MQEIILSYRHSMRHTSFVERYYKLTISWSAYVRDTTGLYERCWTVRVARNVIQLFIFRVRISD